MIIKLIRAIAIISIFILIYCICIIIHELGHLVMGKVSGYTFSSFRIGCFKLIRKDEKWKLMHENITGIAGQCTMLPPDSDEPENVPFVLYHWGGALFNLLTGLCGIPVVLCSSDGYVKIFFLLLVVISLYLALTNSIPIKLKVPNDGYNIRLGKKNIADRIAMYQMLRISANTELSVGEMPESYFRYLDSGEYVYTMKSFNGIRCLEQGRLDEAIMFLEESAKINEDFYRLEIEKELLFCLILKGERQEKIQELYTDKLKTYLSETEKNLPSSRRVLLAYSCMENPTVLEEGCNELYKKLRNLSAGDEKHERILLDLLKKRCS